MILAMDAAGEQPRGLRQLATDMASDAKQIARREVELAQAEVAEKAGMLGAGSALVAGAIFLGVVSFLVLVAAAVLALSLVVDPWLAAVIVALVLVAVAALLGTLGTSRVQRGTPLKPNDSIEHARQDLTWFARLWK
jgi:hypothetical protein